MHTHDLKHLAKRLKRERERLGLTQEELGKKIDLPEAIIWKIENLETIPGALELAHIARALRVSTDYLLEAESTLQMREKIVKKVEEIPLDELNAIAKKLSG